MFYQGIIAYRVRNCSFKHRSAHVGKSELRTHLALKLVVPMLRIQTRQFIYNYGSLIFEVSFCFSPKNLFRRLFMAVKVKLCAFSSCSRLTFSNHPHQTNSNTKPVPSKHRLGFNIFGCLLLIARLSSPSTPVSHETMETIAG